MTSEKSILFEPRNVNELTDFLKANKENYHEIWIVLTKKDYANHQPVTFADAVSKAAKQGLVDSRTKGLDERRYAIRFTKRKDKKNRST